MAFIHTASLHVMAALAGLRARLAEERGQDLIEYALLGGFIGVTFAVAAAVLLGPFGVIDTMVDTIAECIDFSTDCGTP